MPTKADLEGWTPARKDGAVSVPHFDLSKINVVQLARDLSVKLQTPQPRGWLKLWWHNQRLPMENQRLSYLKDYVERISEINSSVTTMQAELFVQPQILELTIQGKIAEARYAAELQFKQHENAIHTLDQEMRNRELVTEKVRVEVEQLKAQTRITELQGNLLEKITKELDLNNITPEQAFVLVKALNPQAEANVDFAATQVMIEGKLAKMKAEAEKLRQEARREQYQADRDEAESKATIRDYEDSK